MTIVVAGPAKVETSLAENPDIAFVETVFASLDGVPRSERLRRWRIEHRVAGVDTSPDPALAAMLAGARHGLAGQIDPGAATPGAGHAAVAGDRLPRRS